METNSVLPSPKTKAVGIDLGTTYSCVAVFRNGFPDTLENDLGSRTTASWVNFRDTGCVVGEHAKNGSAKSTVYDSKRMIGRKMEDTVLQADITKWPFTVRNEYGLPKIEVLVEGTCKGKVINEDCHQIADTYQIYSPEEISAQILTRMKEAAERKLGGAVTKAVVTVPAYFNNSQRKATMDAAKLAGLEVLRLLSEPFAAAIEYGFREKPKEKKNILVYDLGGGTLDITILTICNGNFTVKAINGNTHLGGEDFTDKVYQYVKAELKDRNVEILESRSNSLRKECDMAKRCLSSPGCLEYKIWYNNECVRLWKATFEEELCYELFESTLDPIHKALVDAKLHKTDIHEILMTGGSTRIPKIQELVKNFFHGKTLNMTLNVDETVAHGAAIMAAFLSGDQQLKDLEFIDVTPLSLGIRDYNGDMAIVVEKNSSIPLKKSKPFETAVDNQTAALFEIFEGERPIARDNKLLNTFAVSNIPEKPRGEEKFDVEFHMSSDGILTVTATLMSNPFNNGKAIITTEGRMNDVEIGACIKVAELRKSEDEQTKIKQIARYNLERYIYQIKRKLDEGATKWDADKIKILEKCDAQLLWLRNELADVVQYESKKIDLQRDCERFGIFV